MEDITRLIWCDRCNDIELHIIKYQGTKTGEKAYSIVFDSLCLKCQDEYEHRLKKWIQPVTHVVPVNDYNALIKREIYAQH